MPNLPTPFDGGRPSRSLAKVARLQEKAELAIYKANLEARFRAAVDEADSRALADAVETAGVEEIRVMKRLLNEAEGAPAAKALVARLVAAQSDLDVRRISRRFAE